MIFTDQDLMRQDGIFAGWGNSSDLYDWSSKLPAMSVYTRLVSDPALRTNIMGGGSWMNQEDPQTGALIATAPQMFVAELGMYSLASGLRNTVANISITLGYLQNSIHIVQGLFHDPIQTVATALNVASDILNSDAFNAAINSIGWIPIVGWIIKILVEVAKIVTSIIGVIADKKQAAALEALAARTTVPQAEWSADADSIMAQYLQRQALGHNLQWMLYPRYPAQTADDFTGTPINVDNDAMGEGFLVYSKDFINPSLDMPVGMGFVPGTRNLHGAMELRQPGNANIADIGNFYPTAQAMAANIWEQMLKGHPMALSVDTDAAIEAWASYAYAALDFAMPTGSGGSGILARGWSGSPTASFGASQHKCVDGMHDCSGHEIRFAKMKDIPGDGHTDALVSYYQTLFEWKRKNNSGDWGLGNLDPYTIRPTIALRELRSQQESILNSLQCMYVDDAAVPSGIASVARFAGIGTASNPGPLHSLWQQNVQKVFDSGGWEHVRWSDVPPHPDPARGMFSPVRQHIEMAVEQKYSMSADEFFATKHQWQISVPQLLVPKSPVPPPAPTPPTYIETAAFVDASLVGGARSAVRTSAAPLAMAAGIALLLLKGRK